MLNKKLLTTLLLSLLSTGALAMPITQSFSDSWSVSVGDNGFATEAKQWNYQPYVLAPADLHSVELDILFTVSDFVTGDDFNFRTSFFTGWIPSEYQFYIDQTLPNISGDPLVYALHYTFDQASDLDNWTNSIYGPNGHYYFESTTSLGGHSINATTTLTYNVPEPSTVALLALGIVALLSRRALS